MKANWVIRGYPFGVKACRLAWSEGKIGYNVTTTRGDALFFDIGELVLERVDWKKYYS